MLGEVRLAQRGRRLALLSMSLPVVALTLWFSGLLRLPEVFSVTLLGVVGIQMLAASVAARPGRLSLELGRELHDCPPPLELTRVLIVGAGSSARHAAAELESSGTHEVVGFVADQAASGRDCPRILGDTDDIPSLVRRLNVNQVIVAEVPSWQQRLNETINGQDQAPIDVHVVPGLYEARVGRLRFHRVRDLPLVDLAPAHISPAAALVKRSVDLVFAVVGLVLTAPAVALAALTVKLTSQGPVLFRQERAGKGGRSFTIYKLRTMVVDAEKNTGPVLSAGASDARITPVGKLLRATRLDELPQLVNVLRGDMSIVGPRPERPCFVQKYEAGISGYGERHAVQPGITGLAQVNGGYAIDAEMKLRYDLLYIYSWSLWLDLKIMFQTVATVVRRTGQ